MENKKNIAQMFEGPVHNLVWKNRYNEMIGDAYKNYCISYKDGHEFYEDEKVKRSFTKEEFINKIKTDDEFADNWGKITERELSFDERKKYGIDILGYESLLDYGHSQNDDDIILELLNEWNVPTKIITLEYDSEIVEYYE